MSMKELFNDRLAIKPEGMSDAERTAILSGLFNYISQYKQQFMGFQDNMMLNFPDIHQFMQLSLNNVGDPFVECSNANNTKAVEVHVLDYFARLWNVKYPHDPNDPESYWGYLLCMGSTEGNLYGLWQAREYLLGNTTYVEKNDTCKVLFNNVNGQYSSQSKMPIAFFSEACHYSIIKGCRMLSIPLFCEIGRQYYKNENPLGGEWPDAIPCDEHGAVDGTKLIRMVEFFASKGHPPIVIMNYGTTFTGNYDDIEKIGAELMPILRKHNMEDRELVFEHKTEIRKGYWFHVDAALGGSYSNFLRNAREKGKYSGPVPPRFDFSNKWVHSICASGHKWIGSPWPCGIFLTRVGFHLPPNGSSMYIGCPDSTLSGSRNGTTALVMWDFFSKHSEEVLENRIIKNMQDAEYATAQLLKLSYELGAKHAMESSPILEEEKKQCEDRNDWLWVARAPASLSVRFKRPNPSIVKKFSLSAQNVQVDIVGVGKVTRPLCHIYVMHHVDRSLIDSLIQTLREPGAFDFEK